MHKHNTWTTIGTLSLVVCVLQSPQSEATEPKGVTSASVGGNVTNEEQDPVDALLANAVVWLREARGDVAKVEAAIRRYLKEGDALELSPYELRDYFDISTPTLTEQAHYSAKEQAEASEVFTRVSKKRYGS